MSETEVDRKTSAWLAAYAIGLVVSHDPTSLPGPCAGELARAAGDDRAALERARHRIADVATVGPGIRAAAVALLDAAIISCRPGRTEEDDTS